MRYARTLVPAMLLGLVPAAGTAQESRPTNPYDGRWSVILVCEDVKEDGALTKGYEFRFYADVADGRLKGQYGSPGSPSSVTLVGTVAPDGTLEIRADGNTGKSDHTVGRVPQGTHYRYTMEGRLSGTQGSARRRELRPCTATFAKSG